MFGAPVISAGVDSSDLAKRGESLIRQSTNRYLTTVRIAFRAKQRRFDDFDGLGGSMMVYDAEGIGERQSVSAVLVGGKA